MHLEDVLRINGELLCREGKTIDKDKVLVSFKEWLDSQGLGFGGDFRPYITDDEFKARFDISHDCVNFRNDLNAIKIKKQWKRDLIIKKLNENNIEITEDNINNYNGTLFDTYEEAIKWHKDLMVAQQDEFIMA